MSAGARVARECLSFSLRYERSSLILTSNKFVVERPERFGNHAVATTILDRLMHHSTVLSLKGHSYRPRERALAQRGETSVALRGDQGEHCVSGHSQR